MDFQTLEGQIKMVEKINAYQASDGTIHKSERDANIRELSVYLESLVCMNLASRQCLVEHIAADPGKLMKLVENLCREDGYGEL